jgi:hypothetical protein
VKASERYSDYKSVGGLQIAHTRRTKGAQMDMTVKVDSIQFPKTMDGSIFEKPATSPQPKPAKKENK